MKAVRFHKFGGPEVLMLEEVPSPAPGPGQLLIRNHAIGINPVETYLRSGSNPKLPLPCCPGSDAGGVVESIGTGITRLKPGNRVYTSGSISGTYAELTLSGESTVHLLPENISFEQGAALGVPYATAYRALFQRGGAKAGERLLIHGASGGVGLAAVQWAVAAGLHVVGTAGTEAGLKLVMEQGASEVMNHREPGYLEKLAGEPFDLILEMLANVNLGKDLSLLARHGRVVVIGSRGKVEITPRDLMTREADIRAMVLFNAGPEELGRIHAALGAGLRNRTLRPVIHKKLPLERAVEGHREVIESTAYGKIILVP